MLRAEAYAEGASCSPSRQEEIVWTLFMMDRIYKGASAPIPRAPSRLFQLPLVPAGPTLPNKCTASFEAYILSERRTTTGPKSLNTLITELILMWGDTIEFIFTDTSPSTVPVWAPQSRRAEILGELLDFENSKHHGPNACLIADQ